MLLIAILISLLIRKEWNGLNRGTRLMVLILLYSALLFVRATPCLDFESGIGIYNGLWIITAGKLSIVILTMAGAVLLLDKNSEKSTIALISLLGSLSVINSADLVSLILAIELQSHALYVLSTDSKEWESSRSSGLKYFLLGSLSSGFILLGSSLIYGLTGLTQIDAITMVIGYLNPVCITLTILGMLVKIAAAPFYNWAPDVYDGVPTQVTAWIAVFPKISIIYKLFTFVILWGTESLVSLLLISSTLSMIVGSLLGLTQYRIKRLLAYSGVTHTGYVLLGILGHDSSAVSFYIIQYTVTLVTTFLILLSMDKISGVPSIETISQIRKFSSNWLLGLSLTVCLLSLAGIPPFIGFIAKFYIFQISLNLGYYLMTLIACVTSVIACAYYLKIIQVIFFDNVFSSKIKNNWFPSGLIAILTWTLIWWPLI